MPKPKPGTAEAKPDVTPRPRRKNGQPKQDDGPRRASPTEVRRIMDHAHRLGIDARVMTVLGRLNMTGELTDSEFAAGSRMVPDPRLRLSEAEAPIHRDLRTPKYKPRVIPDKKRKLAKRWARKKLIRSGRHFDLSTEATLTLAAKALTPTRPKCDPCD